MGIAPALFDVVFQKKCRFVPYLQGRAETEHPQPAPACEQFIDLLDAFAQLPQEEPYSSDVKPAHDWTAVTSACLREGKPAELPSWK